MLREEIQTNIGKTGIEAFKRRIFDGFEIEDAMKDDLITSLLSCHHLLILGPPGSGKTNLANRIANILNDIEVVDGCPLNCSPDDALCPWCLDKINRGIPLSFSVLSGAERIKRVQGSGGLISEDLIGDIDLEMTLREGIYSPRAFIPGKLLRANRGILVIDFIDRVPERVLNTILYALQGESITIGSIDQPLSLDVLIIGTGDERVIESLPLDLADCFDVVRLDYVSDSQAQQEIISDYLPQHKQKHGQGISEATTAKVIDIVNRTRRHDEVKRGVSMRGAMNYAALSASFSDMGIKDEDKILRDGALVTLPHRLKLPRETDLPGKREEIVDDVVSDALGVGEKEEAIVTLSKEDIQSLVEELVREDSFKVPLKYGAFDLLLKRVKEASESKFAQIYRQVLEKLVELYPERYTSILSPDLLLEIEEDRKKNEQLKRLLELEALEETIKALEQRNILEYSSTTGWGLSQRGITFLLESLAPKLMADSYLYGYGKHSTGKKSVLGEGKIIGTKHFHLGDRYRDISLKDTMREAIRNRHEEITKEDIIVVTKDIRTKLNIVLLIDLSGTMRQLQKLWYAKQSAIALTLSTTYFGDNVSIITFSNLAEVVTDLSSNVYKVTRKILDLELHENAFTNVGFAISKACNLLAHHPKGKAKQHIIIISDGDATAPHPSPEKYALRQAAIASHRGISISSVCIVQQSANPDLMRRIARIGKGRIYYVGAEELPYTLVEEALTARGAA